MGRVKLVFFDMEGQIFEPGVKATRQDVAVSVWTYLAQHISPECFAEEEATKDKWLQGKYENYVAWMEDTIRAHQKHGLSEQLFNDVINKVEYVNGVKETIAALREKGFIIAIISGGFKNLANRAIRDLGIHHVFAACEYFFDEKTKKLTGWNLLPADYEGKVDFMKLLIKEHGLTPKECAFVGDGINDVPLAKEVGLSIAFNGHPELQKVATHSVNQKDLREILGYF